MNYVYCKYCDYKWYFNMYPLIPKLCNVHSIIECVQYKRVFNAIFSCLNDVYVVYTMCTYITVSIDDHNVMYL